MARTLLYAATGLSVLSALALSLRTCEVTVPDHPEGKFAYYDVLTHCHLRFTGSSHSEYEVMSGCSLGAGQKVYLNPDETFMLYERGDLLIPDTRGP